MKGWDPKLPSGPHWLQENLKKIQSQSTNLLFWVVACTVHSTCLGENHYWQSDNELFTFTWFKICHWFLMITSRILHITEVNITVNITFDLFLCNAATVASFQESSKVTAASYTYVHIKGVTRLLSRPTDLCNCKIESWYA